MRMRRDVNKQLAGVKIDSKKGFLVCGDIFEDATQKDGSEMAASASPIGAEFRRESRRVIKAAHLNDAGVRGS